MPRVKGERKLEILKALAQMLEAPRWARITTAALAAKLDGEASSREEELRVALDAAEAG